MCVLQFRSTNNMWLKPLARDFFSSNTRYQFIYFLCWYFSSCYIPFLQGGGAETRFLLAHARTLLVSSQTFTFINEKFILFFPCPFGRGEAHLVMEISIKDGMGRGECAFHR